MKLTVENSESTFRGKIVDYSYSREKERVYCWYNTSKLACEFKYPLSKRDDKSKPVEGNKFNYLYI